MALSDGVIQHMQTLYKEEWEYLAKMSKSDLIAAVIVARNEAAMLTLSIAEYNERANNDHANHMNGRKSVGGVTV